MTKKPQSPRATIREVSPTLREGIEQSGPADAIEDDWTLLPAVILLPENLAPCFEVAGLRARGGEADLLVVA